MKKTILFLLRSLFRDPAFFLRFKDSVMANPAEHLYRTKKYIHSHNVSVEKGTIIDVGAASGDTTQWFAAEFPSLKVIAFEPLKEACQAAKRKTQSLSNVEVHQIALGDENGTSVLNVTSDRLASSLKEPMENENGTAPGSKIRLASRETVAVKRLDDAVGNERVLLLKIDTQGYELQVLKGAAQTLRRTELILIEMCNHDLYKGGARYWEVDSLLREHGFKLIDVYVTYRPAGIIQEYDALYRNQSL